jgi:UDP-glucuronate 4-epimerase
MHVLVTGGAGFIGSHLVEALLARGDRVTVLDSFDPYYDPARKRANVAAWDGRARVIEGDLRDPGLLALALTEVEAVVHLAARAGVRASLAEPALYVDVNVTGTQVLLDSLRTAGVDRLVYASSSSVYGARSDGPFRESDPVLAPVSPYAATKLAGEHLCQAASHSHGLRVSCMRLFTVYGPRQRPEMAIHLFARRALAGLPVEQFGDGSSRRDYTFVGDIVSGLVAALDRPQPFRVFNLGNGSPVTLVELLAGVERVFAARIERQSLPDQQGDVPLTWASVDRAAAELGYAPQVPLITGLERFRAWIVGNAPG